jgi:hypothetical protein
MKPVSNAMRLVVVFCAAMMLAACGGGGEGGGSGGSGGSVGSGGSGGSGGGSGGSGGGGSQTGITLNASSTNMNASAVYTNRGLGEVQFTKLYLTNMTQTDVVYLGGTYSTNGISSVQPFLSGLSVNLSIHFKNPFELPVGVYSDTIQVRACLEWPCVNNVVGSPKTINVTYTILAPISPPTVTLSQSSLSIEGFVLDTAAPPWQTFDMSFNDIGTPATNLHFEVAGTTNAIISSGFDIFGSDPNMVGRVTMVPNSPASLGAGSFTDTVTVKACLDSQCLHELAGSPATATLHYLVSDTITGPNGFKIRPLPIWAGGIAWDAARQRFYVSIPISASSNANSIGILDPATWQITSYVPVGTNPGELEMSADGQYLYVVLNTGGNVQRMNLSTMTVEATIPMGTTNGGSSQLFPRELHVSPDSPLTFAVVRSVGGTPYDLAVFDDATMRTQTVGGATPDKVSTFRWETGSRIFAVDNTTNGTAFQIAADANGLSVTSQQVNVAPLAGRAFLEDGQMVMQTGLVFDPLTYAPAGSFALGPTNSFASTTLDADIGRAFFYVDGSIKSFDLSSHAPIASQVLFPTDQSSSGAQMIRWGSDGLALVNNHAGVGLLIINGPFVKPQPAN